MSRCLVLAALLLVATTAFAEVAIPASLAAGKVSVPIPLFREVHEAFTRLVLNESGFKSEADQEGILKALLFGGGGRDKSRVGVGAGYGLDYAKLMTRMAQHSTRTFPPNSKFLVVVDSKVLAHKNRLRTYQTDWTSTMRLDCFQPGGWDEGRSGPWVGYIKRCAELVESTARALRGELASHCDGPITTWGSHEDRGRGDGAIENSWRETHCDRPARVASDPPQESCDELRESRRINPEANIRLLNSTNCARNFFFSWLPDKTS